MELRQIEKLKQETNDIRVLRLLIDKDMFLIDDIINFMHDFKHDNMVRQFDNLEYLINYLSDAYDYDEDLFFSNISRILENSKILSTSKRRELLEYYKKHNYDIKYGFLLECESCNAYSIKEIDEVTKLIIDKDLVSNLLITCQYRNLKELKDIALNYEDDVKNSLYTFEMAQYRTHNESIKQIKEYKKLVNELNNDNEKDDKSKKETIKVMKNLFKSNEIYQNRNVDEHIELIKKYMENPNDLLISLIANPNILKLKSYEEQKSLIRILENNNYDINIYNIIEKLHSYNVDEIFKVIGLYQKYSFFDFNEFINKNIGNMWYSVSFDVLYNELVKQISSSIDNYVPISKVIDNDNDIDIDDVINMVKSSKLTSFDSNTKVLQLKIKDNK